MREKLVDHARYIRQFGEDLPEIRNWQWDLPRASGGPTSRTRS
jgi:xylulose-5-phosphate/fructose-6-phosphate phosphoketolase